MVRHTTQHRDAGATIFCRWCMTTKSADRFHASCVSPTKEHGECKACTRNRLVEVNGRRAKHVWSEERCLQLKRLWEDMSVPIPAIAVTFGTTRNAIIGKAHRLGLKDRRAWPRKEPELRQMWADGVLGKEIAKRLGEGLSAHAVRQKANRLGLERRR